MESTLEMIYSANYLHSKAEQNWKTKAKTLLSLNIFVIDFWRLNPIVCEIYNSRIISKSAAILPKFDSHVVYVVSYNRLLFCNKNNFISEILSSIILNEKSFLFM